MRMPTDADVKPEFARLAIALANVLVTRLDGKKENAAADEFMLMCYGDQDEAQFKHSNTRNYVYLFPNGRLVVPTSDRPFNRGEF